MFFLNLPLLTKSESVHNRDTNQEVNSKKRGSPRSEGSRINAIHSRRVEVNTIVFIIFVAQYTNKKYNRSLSLHRTWKCTF